jgi:hypothetical protein
MKHLITHTTNDIPVYVDLIHSAAAKHIAERPYLLGLAAEALQKKSPGKHPLIIEHNFGRTLGYNFIVPTTDASIVFYACVLRDEVYTRFVKNVAPLATTYLTTVLDYTADDTFELRDLWIGRIIPPRPGSADATDAGNTYWQHHAYVFDKQSLQTKTITKEPLIVTHLV